MDRLRPIYCSMRAAASPRLAPLIRRDPARVAARHRRAALDRLQRRRDPDGRRQPDRRARQLADARDGRGAGRHRRHSTTARPKPCPLRSTSSSARCSPASNRPRRRATRPRPKRPPRSTPPGRPTSLRCGPTIGDDRPRGTREPGQRRTAQLGAQLVRSADARRRLAQRTRHRVSVARRPRQVLARPRLGRVRQGRSVATTWSRPAARWTSSGATSTTSATCTATGLRTVRAIIVREKAFGALLAENESSITRVLGADWLAQTRANLDRVVWLRDLLVRTDCQRKETNEAFAQSHADLATADPQGQFAVRGVARVRVGAAPVGRHVLSAVIATGAQAAQPARLAERRRPAAAARDDREHGAKRRAAGPAAGARHRARSHAASRASPCRAAASRSSTRSPSPSTRWPIS